MSSEIKEAVYTEEVNPGQTALETSSEKVLPASGTGSDQTAILQIHDLVKVFETGAGEFTAVNDISLDIQRGEFLGVIGKSGAGKTTLLNLISGVSEITSGEVIFSLPENSGESPVSVKELDENQLAVWRGSNIGIVYQSFELLPQINLVKNIMMPQDFGGYYQPGASLEEALELLDMVEILEHAYKLPAHISGGQKQRVAIARALVNDPPLILADEPTGNLDSVTAETIFQIFEKLVAEGKTIIMVTHDAGMKRRFSQVVNIVDGRIVDEEPTIGADQFDQPDEEILLVPESDHLDEVITETTEPTESDGGFPDSSDGNGSKPARSTIRSSVQPTGRAIQLQDVVKTYVNAAGSFTALKGIDLEMDYGQFISIVGKSGSGKSTLLNMLTGIDHPTSGQVIIGGEDIYRMSESKRSRWRGRNVGIVFQFFQLLPTLTLLENTMLPMDYSKVFTTRERPKRAMELLDRVGLAEHAYKLPAMVSSGQQQSAAIARSLATDPPIIMADEPTGNLDSKSASNIIQFFNDLARAGKTIMIVTHDPTITRRTDQTVILSDGEIIDEAVARALPLLNHPDMLAATKGAEKRIFEPRQQIIEQGQPIEHLFLIAEGDVDVVLNNPGCPETPLARLGKGQYFGEVELFHNQQSIASVRAGRNGPAELLLLPKDTFNDLMQASPRTREEIQTTARTRKEENLSEGGCDD